MADSSVDVRTDVDGSVVVQPHGVMDDDSAVHFRQVLVHAVRKVRPLRLILDLSDVSDIDPINLGTMAALCDLADDHHVDRSSWTTRRRCCRTNCRPPASRRQRLAQPRTPVVAG